MEGTSQVAQQPAQTNSAVPTSYAPSAVSQSATSVPQQFQASAAPVADPMQGYQVSAQAPQASAPQGNPWQQAFQALSASLNTSNPSQAQVSPSAYQTTPTPQATTQPNWASAVSSQPQAAPTYSPQPSTQNYSEAQVSQLVQQAALAGASNAQDQYLSGISDESLEVLQHFGAEAPNLLNTYACAVEDALIEQVQRGNSLDSLLQSAAEERGAMNVMLTDPDVLADYVNEFFGANGPYPTETAEETQEREQAEARAQFEAEIMAQEQNRQVPQNFQRPEMEMPTPGRQSNPSNDFWGSFSEMMDSSPENAWKYLAQAPQGALQAKALIQDL